MYVHSFFRYNTTAHLIDYSICKPNFYMHSETQEIYLTCFTMLFALCTGTEPTISLRYAHILLSWCLCGVIRPETSHSTLFLTHTYFPSNIYTDKENIFYLLVFNLGKINIYT